MSRLRAWARSPRLRAAIKRFSKVTAAAAAPVLLSAMHAGAVQPRELLLAVTTALLAAAEKAYGWTDIPANAATMVAQVRWKDGAEPTWSTTTPPVDGADQGYDPEPAVNEEPAVDEDQPSA